MKQDADRFLSVLGQYLAVTVICIAVGAPTLLYPFGRDQGEYATIAWLLREGFEPYVDIVNIKPPGTYLTHLASQLLFGHSMLSIRLLDLLLQVGTCLMLFACSRILSLRNYAQFVVPLTYILTYYSLGFWDTAQTESFQSFFSTAAMYLFIKSIKVGQSRTLLALSGAMVACAGLFKYPMWLMAPILAIGILATTSHRTDRLRALFSWAFGFGMVIIAVMIHLGLEGMRQMVSQASRYYAIYYSDAVVAGLRGGLSVKSLALFGSGLLFLVVLVKRWSGQTRSTLPFMVIALWGGTALVQILLQQKFYFYHFIALIAPASLCLVISLLQDSQTRSARRSIGLIAVVLYLVSAASGSVKTALDGWRDMPVLLDRENLQAYYRSERFGCYDCGQDFSSRATLEAAESVQRLLSPGEPLTIWGFEPGVYFLSQRRPATRFIYNFLLYPIYEQSGFLAEFIDAVQQQSPALFLVVQHDVFPWVTGTTQDSQQVLESVKPLRKFISEKYVYHESIEDFRFYRLAERHLG